MFSDDFMGTSFGGRSLSKSDVVPPDGSTSIHMPKCSLKDSTVRIFGDTAVLMGEVEMQVQQKPEEMRMTTVFRKHPDGWQILAVHMSSANRTVAVDGEPSRTLVIRHGAKELHPTASSR